MSPADQFEAIVSAHYEPLYRFAMSLTRTEADARDLTQQTFFRWATKGHQLRDGTKVKTWLYTTLHRAFLEMRRRQSRFPHFDWEEVVAELPVHSPARTSPSDCAHVLCALEQVDEVYQAAVALFYLEDQSYKDIAAILEVPVGTVKSRIARGLGQLREMLASDQITAHFPAAASHVASAGCRRAEWVFSATRLPEQLGAAEVLSSARSRRLSR